MLLRLRLPARRIGGGACKVCGESPFPTIAAKVENVVSERIIESHEDAATVFVAGAGLAMLVALGAWAAKSGGLRTGLSAATVLVSVVVAGLAIRTGHSGGELVYVHGAAAAHVQVAGGSGPALGEAAVRADEDDDD